MFETKLSSFSVHFHNLSKVLHGPNNEYYHTYLYMENLAHSVRFAIDIWQKIAPYAKFDIE